MSARAWIAAGTSWPVLDRKSTKAAQLDSIALGHRTSDFTKDRVDDVLNVALIKMWVLGRNALDEF